VGKRNYFMRNVPEVILAAFTTISLI